MKEKVNQCKNNDEYRTKKELINDYKIQMKFLNDFCVKYDEGHTEYALQIASTLRLLLHDTNKSHALLNQLYHKGITTVDFVDTCIHQMPIGKKITMPNEKVTPIVRNNLCYYTFNHSEDSEPILTPTPLLNTAKFSVYRSFGIWWNKTTTICYPNSIITRKRVVTLLANNDGGAHIDPNIEEDLRKLKRIEVKALTICAPINGVDKKYIAEIDKVLYATVRQIAEEVRISFEKHINID